MRVYEVGDRVRIANIPDPPFPSVIGDVGVVKDFVVGDQPIDTERLYTVQIGDRKFACYGEEIEPAE